MDQQRFDFPPTGDEPKRRRRRQAKHPLPVRKRRLAQTGSLTVAPVLQACGRCGHQQTVQGETALCSECGGIIMRSEDNDS